MLHDPEQSANIYEMFPRFLDTKGLVLQDFLLMFGAETASRFLEKWNTSFKDKVIRETSDLKDTPLLKKHLKSALNEESSTADEPEWDSDIASLLVLLHLLTPQPAGRKQPKKRWRGNRSSGKISVLTQPGGLPHCALKETPNHIFWPQGLQKHRFPASTLSWINSFFHVSHVHP